MRNPSGILRGVSTEGCISKQLASNLTDVSVIRVVEFIKLFRSVETVNSVKLVEVAEL